MHSPTPKNQRKDLEYFFHLLDLLENYAEEVKRLKNIEDFYVCKSKVIEAQIIEIPLEEATPSSGFIRKRYLTAETILIEIDSYWKQFVDILLRNNINSISIDSVKFDR